MMRYILLLALLALLLAGAAAAAQPYTTAHFEIYDLAGAGQSYLQSLGSELESAYSALAGEGVRLAPPCSGSSRYTVYVKSMSGSEGGYTSWQYSYDASGRITSSCILHINFSAGLSGSALRKTAFHEMAHVAQAAYFGYHAVVQAYPWYVEASAEGVAGRLTGICTWEYYFYSASLYSRNPYSYSDGQTETYMYSAFFNWLLASHLVSDTLSSTLSSSTVQNSWLNGAYLSYLLSIVRGQSLCGRTYTPSFQKIYLSGSWSATVSLDGLSAAYYAIQLPSGGVVEVKVEGASLRSNLKLNEPFVVQNTTLYLALANPSTSSVSAKLTISALPMLTVELVGGAYDASSRVLKVALKVAYALKPVSGAVTVNGTEYQAVNGLVNASFSGVNWGSYTLVVNYGSYSQSVKLSVAQPSFSAVTNSPVYLSPSGYGLLVLQASNTGDVSVSVMLLVKPQVVGGAEILKPASPSFAVTIPPSGSQRIEVPFTVGKLAEGEVLVKVSSASGEVTVARFRVVPVELHVLEATHSLRNGVTYVKLSVPQLGVVFEKSFKGLSGEAVASYDTYAIGKISVQLPPVSATIRAEPELVAPGWALLRLSVVLRSAGACPTFPTNYNADVLVNGTALGSTSFRCGEQARVEGGLNATQRNMRVLLVVNNQWVAEVTLTPPTVILEPLAWLITDHEVVANISVSVRGPHAYYLLGKVFRNSSELYTFSAGAGLGSVVVDTGFSRQAVRVPVVKVSLSVPEVILAPRSVVARVVVESEAAINANLAVKLNGTAVATLRVSKNSTQPFTAALQLQPPSPGFYRVEVNSWFANASALLYYVKAAGVRIRAPAFLLVGMPANVTVEVYAKPPLPLPVRVSIEIGGKRQAIVLSGNSSLLVDSPAAPSTAVVEASLLNYTSTAKVTWDLLNLAVENVLGFQDGLPLVPNGSLRGFAAFSNKTRASVRVLVNGVETYTPPGLGRVELNLSAKYLDVSNSTVIAVYVVPAEEYRAAADLRERLRGEGIFEQLLREAVRSGDWSAVTPYTAAYLAAKARAELGDPLGHAALVILEKGARDGNAALASLAENLIRYELLVYMAFFALCATAVFMGMKKQRRRKHENLGGSQSL